MVMDPKTMRPVQSAAAGVAPTVTLQPTNETVSTGGTATFTAAASGTPTPTVQWQLSTDSGASWGDIGGANATSYTTPTLTLSEDQQQYRAVFTNASGSATTNAATVDVVATPVVTLDPTNATQEPGETATFTSTASGDPTPTVQWQVSTDGGSSWADIGGATSGSYTTPTLTAGDDGKQYRAVWTNSEGSATSNAATLSMDVFYELEWIDLEFVNNPTNLLLN